jgi:hypothetical protein
MIIRTAAARAAKLPLVQLWLRIKPYVNRFFMSRYFMLAEFAAACGVIMCGWEISGAVLFFWLAISALVFCNDILSAAPPVLYMSVFLTKCYDSADVFLGYIWLAVPAALAVLFHLAVYRHKWQIGPNFWGSAAVAAAVTLGGLGTISKEDYFNPTSLFYTGALGAGMVAFYLVSKAYISEKEDYDIFGKFAGILYSTGALAALAVLRFYYNEWDTVMETHALVDFQSSNNLATLLMIAMPFPCWFALKNKKHLLGFAAIYAAVILSGSRGGLVMGTAEFFVCLAYLAATDKKSRFTYVCSMLAFAALVYMNIGNILAFYKLSTPADLITQNEARYGLLLRMREDFKANMLFGRGIGYSGNEDLYNPVKGAMHWYHMMIPQIVGSLGITGVVAYVFQWIIRARTILYKTDAYLLVLGASYLGLFLMSQVNPGEFSPVPYAMIGVLTFVMAEKYQLRKILQ